MNDLRSPQDERPYRHRPHETGQEDVFLHRLRQHRLFPMASLALGLILFGAVISYAYRQGSQSGVNATTPVVVADNADYKTKPDNPGGMDVPFQDAVVFDEMQTKQAAGEDKIESLLPAAEQPLTTAQNGAKPAVDKTVADKTADTLPPPPPIETPKEQGTIAVDATPQQPTEAATQTAAVPAKETFKDVVKETAQDTAKTPAKEAATKTATAPAPKETAKLAAVAPAATAPTMKIESGTYRVQLGAFKDEAAARAAWAKFKNQYNSQLSSVTPEFPRVDLGDKTVYRVQGTHLSKASAEQICSSINAAKSGGCIVTTK